MLEIVDSKPLRFMQRLDGKLCLRPAAARVGGLGVATEFDLVIGGKLQDILKPLADLLQPLLAFLAVPALSSGRPFLWRLARGAGPQTDTPKALANVDNDPHNLIIVLILELLADGSQHDVKPHIVVGFVGAFKGERPAPAKFVLRILPFRTYAAFEEMVVGLLGKLRGWRDVVLCNGHVSHGTHGVGLQ